MAKGDYLIFLDVDDLYSTDYVEQMVRTANESDADMVIFQLTWEDSTDGTVKKDSGFIKTNIPKDVVL